MNESPRERWSAVLFRDWGTKALALALTVVLFVVTRNEVTRGFRVPLEVIDDPERVLVTDVPDAIRVEVRGPWSRVNRLHDYDIAPVRLDLRNVGPGPLHIDPASVVMPSGVLMARIVYPPVDLRFEPVVERALPVETKVVGDPDPDHEVVRVEVEPPRWPVRGGRTAVRGLGALATEPVEINGLDHTVVRDLALRTPPETVHLVESRPGVTPQVRVRVVIEPIQAERELEVPIIGAEAFDGIPNRYSVLVRGRRRALETLLGHGVSGVQGRVVQLQGGGLELQFDFAPEVTAEIRGELTLEPRRLAWGPGAGG